MQTPPTVFISYSWDGEDHQNWVLQLANKLITEAGINVLLDQYEMQAGHNLNHFMESAVAKAGKVLLILTENYKVKAEQRQGGIGFEYSMISTEWYRNQTNNIKFIPILRGKERDKCVPIFVSSFLTLDMNQEATFEQRFEQLVRQIYDRPAIDKPLMGAPPAFLNSSTPPPSPTAKSATITDQIATQRKEYQTDQSVRALQKECQSFIAKGRTAKALARLLTYAEEQSGQELHNTLLNISAQWSALQRDKITGILASEQEGVKANQINANLLSIISELS